jgi:hypothetical protein
MLNRKTQLVAAIDQTMVTKKDLMLISFNILLNVTTAFLQITEADNLNRDALTYIHSANLMVHCLGLCLAQGRKSSEQKKQDNTYTKLLHIIPRAYEEGYPITHSVRLVITLLEADAIKMIKMSHQHLGTESNATDALSSNEEKKEKPANSAPQNKIAFFSPTYQQENRPAKKKSCFNRIKMCSIM